MRGLVGVAWAKRPGHLGQGGHRAPSPEALAWALELPCPSPPRLAMPCRMAARCGKGCRPYRSSSRRPALRGWPAGALAIAGGGSPARTGMPSAARSSAANAPEHARRDVPGHAVVGEVGQRVAQRGQLPVQHGNDPGLGGVEHQVVQPEVTMNDGHAVFVPCARGHVGGQPGHELVHFRNGLR